MKFDFNSSNLACSSAALARFGTKLGTGLQVYGPWPLAAIAAGAGQLLKIEVP
jgi:hypothetical protein